MNLRTKVIGLSLVAVAVALVATGCKTKQIGTAWMATPVLIDGQFGDWDEYPTAFFEDQKAALSVCNDSLNLYIQLRTNDEATAQSISRSGLTLYLDPNGKKREDFYVKVSGGGPSGPPPGMSGGQMPGGDRPEGDPPKSDRPEMGQRPGGGTDFRCYMKDRVEEKSIPMDGAQGPAAAIGQDQGFYVWEFSFPLKEPSVRYYSLDASPGQAVVLGLEWTAAADGRQGGGRGGGPPGGGGGMGGGPPGGMGGGNQASEQKVWLKAQLAVAPGQDTE